jgi:hypothetical protein
MSTMYSETSKVALAKAAMSGSSGTISGHSNFIIRAQLGTRAMTS